MNKIVFIEGLPMSGKTKFLIKLNNRLNKKVLRLKIHNENNEENIYHTREQSIDDIDCFGIYTPFDFLYIDYSNYDILMIDSGDQLYGKFLDMFLFVMDGFNFDRIYVGIIPSMNNMLHDIYKIKFSKKISLKINCQHCGKVADTWTSKITTDELNSFIGNKDSYTINVCSNCYNKYYTHL